MRGFARHRIAVALTLCLWTSTASAVRTGFLEEAVCGSFKEWLAFSLWSGVAGKANLEATSGIRNVQRISHTTVDGRTLRGFRIAADGRARGALLVAQGNAMLADQLLTSLGAFTKDGLDVFVFDYRGYGISDGTPRLKAIVNDYVELAKAVSKITPGKRYLYGMSFGGIVLVNALPSIGPVDAMVIDSSPSVISDMGCPTRYDPISNVPSSAQHFLMIIGEKDRVIPPSRSAALAGKVRSSGGRVERSARFAHPFMDADPGVRSARLRLIAEFLRTK